MPLAYSLGFRGALRLRHFAGGSGHDAAEFFDKFVARFGRFGDPGADVGDDVVAEDPSAFFCSHAVLPSRRLRGHGQVARVKS
jgi:hypothetical protein